ncbi:MAG: hypothetical protein WA867_01000 [Candidatus Acidiferrales bacterium]
MPERTVKRRLQDCDGALASDDGPIFSTVAKLVEALKRSIPEGTQNAERKKEALRLGRPLTLRKFSEKASFARRKFVLGLAIVVCGLSSLAMAQGTPVPKSVAADQRNAPNVAADQTNAPGVASYPQPPAGFDPLTASDKELTRYGFPPRPDPEKAPEAYAHWQKLVSVPRIANPTLQQTTIYNGPAQHVPTKREP